MNGHYPFKAKNDDDDRCLAILVLYRIRVHRHKHSRWTQFSKIPQGVVWRLADLNDDSQAIVEQQALGTVA